MRIPKGHNSRAAIKRATLRELRRAEAEQTALSEETPGGGEIRGLARKASPGGPESFLGQLKVRAQAMRPLSKADRAAYSIDPEELVDVYAREIIDAYAFASTLKPAVVVFGSARTPENDREYERAMEWGETLALANLFALDKSRAVRAVLSGSFGETASKAVAGAVFGAAAGTHGAVELSQMVAAIGGGADLTAIQAAARLLEIADPSQAILDVLKSVVRSGAGPGIMEAVLTGYQRAVAKLIETQPDLPKEIRDHFEVQGSRIFLPFEQKTADVFIPPAEGEEKMRAPLHVFRHFDPRREALMLNALGIVSEIGGLGTLNEDFVALRLGLPVVFDRPYYGEIVSRILEQWEARGLSPEVSGRVLLADGVETGFSSLVGEAAARPRVRVPTMLEAREKARDFVYGMVALTQMETAVSILGSSHLQADDPAVQSAARIAGRLGTAQIPIRIGGAGDLFTEVRRAAGTKQLQAVLLEDDKLDPAARAGTEVFHAAKSPNVHKVMLYENSDAMIFAPGGDGVFDELFEVLCLMQTRKMPRRPILLIDEGFWGPILEAIQQRMAVTPPTTIDADDLKLVTVVKLNGALTPDDAQRPYGVTDEDGAVAAIRAHRARRISENA